MKHSKTGIAGKFLFLMVGLLCALGVNAQSITVSGTVTDPSGEPLIGASILAEGTTAGTATDIDGNYTINAPSNGTLVFSYVGYDAQEVPVEGRSTINVTMQESSVMLNEVVAIGYGVVKKSDATGSVAVIKPDEVEAGLATSVQDMLVGQTPGVVVTKAGGPEGNANIRIRGEASLSGKSDPLIVVDGVPLSNDGVLGMSNPLAMISPENIESMTVLKDASATAIYGSRASNGVIIITTKKGTKGKPQVNFSANLYVDHARKLQKVLDADGFRNFIANDPRFGVESAAYRALGNANTDWQDEIYRTSVSSDYALSVGGTAGILPYRVSVTYTNSNGILKTSSMDRVTAGFNLTPKFFDDHLSVNANVKGYYVRNQFASTDAIGQAVAYDPTAPVMSNIPIAGGTAGMQYLFNGYTEPYSNDGQNIALLNDGNYNPVATLNQTDNYANVYRSNGNLQLDYSFHFLPELHANLNLGYDVSKSNNFYDIEANSHMAWKDHSKYGGATSSHEYAFRSNTLLDFYLNYRKDFEKIRSNLDVTAGYSWQRFSANGHKQGADYETGVATTMGLLPYQVTPDGIILNWNPATADQVGNVFKVDPNDPDGNYHWRNHLQLLSFFGRINYTFMERYLLTFTLRGDATSRFSKDNRWGVFPAVALGWKINDEAWMQGAASVLSDLKLRLGWGQTGQQDVGTTNNYLPTYTVSQPGSYYPGGLNGGWLTPYFPNGFNKDLTWETTTTWNAGLDYGFLNNRITGSIEAYLRNTTDLLSTVEVPAGSSTVSRLPQNIGSMRNYGVEFSIVAKPVVTNDFTWTLSYNVGWNHNEITDLHGLYFETGGGFGGTGGNCQIMAEGHPLYSFNLYQQVYDENGDPIEGCYVDQDGNGVIDGNDRVINHSALPKVTMTFGSQFRYKQWDFGFNLRSSLGNYVYASAIRGGTATDGIFRNGLNNLFESDVYFSANENLSDYWVRNASFLRCDNITLGYTWDNLIDNKLNLRLFAGVQNPFVITKYKGLDPEVADKDGKANGVDGNIYPRATTWSVGIVANF